ncbi:MAG TPA: hypothetical protein PKC67_02615 [Kiritimatiellia bacterium]|nr:hypothetical protein [Kiritimatiellia bacterium]HMP33219.1 hypothetical protein [Kiritimatiellia bacterium]
MRVLLATYLLVLGIESREALADPSQEARGYPANLFALVVPNAIVTTNVGGFQLTSHAGRTIRATPRGRDWLFTTVDGKTMTAERDLAGWTLTVEGRRVGRVEQNQATLPGERRSTIRTQAGYLTSTTSTSSAEAFFEHRYRK